jgi:HK97 family phage prohead protease
MNEIQYRTASSLEVRHAERVIDMIAVPYDEEAEVMRRDRWVSESIDPDAFTGVAGDVTVNRAHNVESPLGRVTAFHPKDPRGLRTELRISRTRDGDDVLELADDGLLHPSIGFQVLGENWSEDRNTVRVTRAKLVHIALTGDPAYKGAKVLAVRTSDAGGGADVRTATPNLDLIRLSILADTAGVDLQSMQ